MKKKIFLSAAILFAFIFVFGAIGTSAQMGSYFDRFRNEKKSNEEVKAAVDFAMKEKGDRFRLRKVKKAERKTIAGTNFRLTLKITEKQGNKESKYTIVAVVFRDPEGNYTLTEWKRKQGGTMAV